MRRQGKTTTIISLIAALLLVAALPAQAETGTQKKTAQTRETNKKKTGASPLNIQGFRTGMTMKDAKQLLHKKKITGYETAFSDLFVYDPFPGTEVKLQFTCTAKGPVLGTVELKTAFADVETDAALPKLKEQLVAKYGTPSITDSQGDRLDYCWGQCDPGANGAKIEAKTTTPKEGKRSLVLTLSNEGLVNACKDLRPKQINAWLYQWIVAVQKFKLGLPVKDVSLLYQKRYWEKMKLEKECEVVPQQFVSHYALKDCDFFTTLNPASLMFEGQGLGTVMLKFTGDQAGEGSALNKRLYYTSFSTTNFTDKHLYTDVQQKLDAFIKAYGTPAEVIQQPDGVTARWQQETKQRSVTILDSGMIAFEQSDQKLHDSYREAAAENIEKNNKTRFDRPLF